MYILVRLCDRGASTRLFSQIGEGYRYLFLLRLVTQASGGVVALSLRLAVVKYLIVPDGPMTGSSANAPVRAGVEVRPDGDGCIEEFLRA